MAGLSIGERAKLLLLLVRRSLRTVAGRLRGHPFIRLSFIPRKAERLLIAPQDLRTADGTRANARALVDEWISVQGSWDPVAWQPEILSRRVTAWLSQAPLILHDADDAFYRRFLRSLVRQVRYLRHTAIEAREGVPRMQALVALTYAALCMSGQTRHMRGAIKQLVTEVEYQ